MSNRTNLQSLQANIATFKASASVTKQVLSNAKGNLNLSDGIQVLLDLMLQVGGVNDIFEMISDILVSKINNITKSIKDTIKDKISETVTCGISPTLGTDKIIIPITSIDFGGLLKTDPRSNEGRLFYFDQDDEETSDFNVFLYRCFESNEPRAWHKKGSIDTIFTVQFFEKHPTTGEINVFEFDVSKWKNESLSSIIDAYTDSLVLFNTKDILAQIMNYLFGSTSDKNSNSNISKEQTLHQEKLHMLCDKLINEPDETELSSDTLNDGAGWYGFSNDEYNLLLKKTEDKRRGVYRIEADKEYTISLPTSELNTILNNISIDEYDDAGNKREISNMLDSIVSKNNSNNTIETDEVANAAKANLIVQIVKTFVKLVTSAIFSPKMCTLFSFIAVVLGKEPAKSVDEMVNMYYRLIKGIIDGIVNSIVKMIVNNYLVPQLTSLVKNYVVTIAKEKATFYVNQLLTLINSKLRMNRL